MSDSPPELKLPVGPRAHNFFFSTPTHQNLYFAFPEGGWGYEDPIPPITPHNFLCKNPNFKSYIIKGRGGYYKQTRSPLVAQQQPAYQLRTAQSKGEKRREQEIVVTMSTASTVQGPLLQPSFDKTAWLQRVCGKPADGEDFICCCGANLGDSSGMDGGQAIEHECSAQHRECVERLEGCSAILEGIVYLATAAAAASTGKTKLWFITCKSAHHRAVCLSCCLLPNN